MDSGSGGAIRVLHVDDDPEFTDLASTFLERESEQFTVETATSASAGLERLDGAIDCIVSDYDMPGQDGIGFLETVREDHPDLPFILFTGKGSESVASDAISAGVTDYLQKSTDSSQYALLANRIENAVAQYEAERRASEHERERERLRRAMEEAPVGITITDPDQEDNPIIYANRKFSELTGYDQEDVLGENHRFLQGERTSSEPVAKMREAIDEERPAAAELRNYRADGSEFWNYVRIAPVEDESGAVTNYVGFQQDVTERKQRQRELEQQNESLEQFTSVVSHDLRNPLTAAQSRLELAAEECESPHLDDIDKALDRTMSLLEKLLTLARTGQSIEDARWTNLDTIAREAWQNVDPSKMTLTVSGNCAIEADPDRLRQLFENLFQNSIDHAGEDVTVTVGAIDLIPTSTRADDDTYRGFYVADDGPGIDEEIRDDILEWGFTTTAEGTGFGLAIVAQIAEVHDWDVSVTRSYKGGVRFEFTGQGFRQASGV